MTNLSQWFDLAEQKPWEVGVYEVQSKHQPQELGMYSFFDGHVFRYIKRDANSAFNYRADMTFAEIVRWRGLSANPEVKKKQGNRKVTRYVVIDRGGFIDKPVAVFSSKKLAEEYGSKLFAATVKTIRFRTPVTNMTATQMCMIFGVIYMARICGCKLAFALGIFWIVLAIILSCLGI